jgi:hypothetical protein
MSKTILLGLFCLGLLACSATGGASSPSTQALDYPTFIRESVTLGCEFLADCCTADERGLLGYANDEVFAERCAPGPHPEIDSWLDETARRIEAGELVFDAAAAAECLAGSARRANDCAADRVLTDDVCSFALRDAATPGDACSSQSGLCEGGFCDEGLCVTLPTLGEACPYDGLVCEGGTCVGGVCAPPGDIGDPCILQGGCMPGLYCRGALSPASPGECALFDLCE